MGIVLTVVVPAYNVEAYLPKCINSILAQDLSAEMYEIIIVDDGSTDMSGIIADEYAADHENIEVIHQANAGLSAARNAGISAARGKYIQFVDSDDYLEQNVLARLVNKMEVDNLDVLRFNYQNVDQSYEPFHPNKEDNPYVDFRDEVCNGMTFLTERLGYACYACQFLIRTDLLVSNSIFFKEGIFFEDTEWTPRVLSVSGRVTSVPLLVYNYLFRVGSISRSVSVEKKGKVIHDRMELVKSLKHQALYATDRRWYEGMIASIVITMLNEVCRDFSGNTKQYLSEINGLNVYPLSYFHLTKRATRKAKIINVSPRIYCLIYKLKNR